MATLSVSELIENGVHFGHDASRWNPKMKPFIFTKHRKVHIIDVKQTIRGIVRASNFLQRKSAENASILFVGTKRSSKGAIRNEALRCGQHFVDERWLGGTLTNHATVLRRLDRLKELEHLWDSGDIADEAKKMQSVLAREKRKLFRNLDGIRNMNNLPHVMVIVDATKERTAIAEAQKIRIPVIGIVDTDSDPDLVDIAIPANDDSVKSVSMILEFLANAIIEGRKTAARLAFDSAPKKEEEKPAGEAPPAPAISAPPTFSGPKKKVATDIKPEDTKGAYVASGGRKDKKEAAESDS
ncbi:MAG: 30S ribosomal protein S2 [Planctomycetes bacterium]|nr:30S ribosomal protein S2 [Planctomycetota bacterium]